MLEILLHPGERTSYVVHVEDVDVWSAQMVVLIADGWPRGVDPIVFHAGAQCGFSASRLLLIDNSFISSFRWS